MKRRRRNASALGEGIRRKGNRFEVWVKTNGDPKPIRTSFPLDTSMERMQAWRESQRVTPLPGDCLAEDVERYYLTVAHLGTLEERKFHLGWWLERLGAHRQASSVETLEITRILSALKASGKADETVRHYRKALRHFFYTMHPKLANPVRASWQPEKTEPEARAIDFAIVRRIFRGFQPRRLKDGSLCYSKTKARLLLLATTGLPHKKIKEIKPGHIDWAHGRLRIGARKKGKGAAGRWLPLSRHARWALRRFAALDAFGDFSNGSMHKAWRRRLAALDLPAHLRPYDLRHSFATEIYRRTRDEATVGRLLLHAPNSVQARRYAKEAQQEVDAAAVATLRLSKPRQAARLHP